MKRTRRWVVGVGCVGIAFAGIWFGTGRGITTAAQDKPATQPSAPIVRQKNKLPVTPDAAATPQEAGSKAPEHVVYTFESDERMKEFAGLWQKRQTMLLRMSVLKSYWEQEQDALTQLSKNLATDYHLDLSKSYTLDAQRRMILEREAPAAAGAASAAPAGAASSPNPTATTTP